jgi:hypothetical protein
MDNLLMINNMGKIVKKKKILLAEIYLSAAHGTLQKGTVSLGLQSAGTSMTLMHECETLVSIRVTEDLIKYRSTFRSFDELLNTIRYRIEKQDTTFRQCLTMFDR